MDVKFFAEHVVGHEADYSKSANIQSGTQKFKANIMPLPGKGFTHLSVRPVSEDMQVIHPHTRYCSCLPLS